MTAYSKTQDTMVATKRLVSVNLVTENNRKSFQFNLEPNVVELNVDEILALTAGMIQTVASSLESGDGSNNKEQCEAHFIDEVCRLAKGEIFVSED